MNCASIAQLLRQIASELEGNEPPSVPREPRKTVARSYGQEEILKEVLPEDMWEQFDITMLFGKHAGTSLLSIPTSYFKYLGSQDFESRGDELGDLIVEAIQFLSEEPEPPRRPMQRAVIAEPDDLFDNEDAPF